MMHLEKPLFIAFEGIDGSGKTTQIKLLSEHLKQEGIKVYTTFEPTDSPIGSIITNIFRQRIESDHKTIAGLFVADRLDHLLNKTNGILKKLQEGFTVITDRYYLSSYAYQGAHVPVDWVIQANALSAELLRPDLNIFIDITPETGMQRLNNSRSNIELFETTENLKLVRAQYFEVIERLRNEENIFITDGNRDIHHIAFDIWKELSQVFSNYDLRD
jgi:dTMP kinase